MHVENIWTLLAVVATGGFNVLGLWLKSRKDNGAHASTDGRLDTIKILVNGRLSEAMLRIEQLTHELTKNGHEVPPPSTPAVRTIIVQQEGTPNEGNS